MVEFNNEQTYSTKKLSDIQVDQIETSFVANKLKQFVHIIYHHFGLGNYRHV